MTNLVKLTLTCLPVAFLAGACLAQNDEPKTSVNQAKFFRLDFVVKEIEGGKVLNARSYSASISTSSQSQCALRTGSKVPFATSSGSSSTQYTFLDIGVNIDCRDAREVDGQLALVVTAEVSSVAPPATNNALAPVIRQNRWNSPVLVPLRKPMVIFSSDDVGSKGQMQLELTVTPLK